MDTSRLHKELLSLHFGQAGIQIGDAVWQTLCGEHSIDADGLLPQNVELSGTEVNAVNTFFHSGPDSKYIPRALIVDTEPTVVDEIRTGYYRKLFHPDLLLNGLEDASNNFARGYYTLSRGLHQNIVELGRFVIESCDNFQGFLNFSGTGGGTGSGLFTRILERMEIEYSGKVRIGNLLVPGPSLSNCIVDCYNTILRMGKAKDLEDLNFVIDNQSLYRICKQVDIEKPTYHNINKLLTPILTSFTAPARFEGPLTGSINEISTNLIPFPRINLPMFSYAPFYSNSTHKANMQSCLELTMSLFEPSNNLLGRDLSKGMFLSSVMIYRGSHIIRDIVKIIKQLKSMKKFNWVSWCPTGFKIAHTVFPALHSFTKQDSQPDRSVLMLSNHTQITHYLDQILSKYKCLMSKKSYVFWYLGEGMEEMEFKDAYEEVVKIKIDYNSLTETDNEADDFVLDDSDQENLKDNQISTTSNQNTMDKSQHLLQIDDTYTMDDEEENEEGNEYEEDEEDEEVTEVEFEEDEDGYDEGYDEEELDNTINVEYLV